MKLATSAQMRQMDNIAINDAGISSTLLMTNAAGHVAKAAMELLLPDGRCAVFSGSGNNGGDGIAAAVELTKRGYEVKVFLIGKRESMTPDSLEMERRLIEVGGSVTNFEETLAAQWLRDCSVIIDAMFGVGLNSDLRGAAMEATELINFSAARVVSADISSGVQADTGAMLGGAVKADVTVTFTCPKPGQYIEPGAAYSGDIRVVDIGIPEGLEENMKCNTHLVTSGNISLPPRASNTHKGNYGKILMICGSTGYTGALTLAAASAVRSGAGLVYLGVPKPIYEITAVKNYEAMPYPLPSDDEGRLTENALPWIVDKLKKSDALLIGPGLGRSCGVDKVVCEAIKASTVPVIIDADGINAISRNINVLDEAPCPIILTPHEGELMRLTGGGIKGGRLKAAREFAVKHNCAIVLKGPGTISAFGDDEAYVNTTGNPGMAKGGSGDVLAGILTALVGQGLELKRAVYTAVWLHGRAGDVLRERLGSYAMMPSELIDALPEVLKKIER